MQQILDAVTNTELGYFFFFAQIATMQQMLHAVTNIDVCVCVFVCACVCVCVSVSVCVCVCVCVCV